MGRSHSLEITVNISDFILLVIISHCKVLSKGVTPIHSHNKLNYHLLCAKHYCEIGVTAINNHAILCTHRPTIPLEETVAQSVNK